MKLPTPRHAFALLSLLGALLAFVPPSGWALCLSADGHVAMEPACADGPRAPGAPCEQEADDCGPCVDIEIASQGEASPAKKFHTLVQDSAPVQIAVRSGEFDCPPPAPQAIRIASALEHAPPILPQRLILIL